MRKELLTERDDVFVVHDFLTPAECDHYIALSEGAGYTDAPISTLAGPEIRKGIRNNDRLMLDDPTLAAALWDRLRPLVPERRGSWAAAGLNERLRFYRYDPGQRFAWHFDGPFERSPVEVSALTFMVYLNGGFEGGATEFNFRPMGRLPKEAEVSAVVPEAGKALVFNHKILHQGAAVTAGRKYVLRSDVMYRWTRDDA